MGYKELLLAYDLANEKSVKENINLFIDFIIRKNIIYSIPQEIYIKEIETILFDSTINMQKREEILEYIFQPAFMLPISNIKFERLKLPTLTFPEYHQEAVC